MAHLNSHVPQVVAISTSDSPDMTTLGLSDNHLREAVADFAIFLLAAGSNLAYAGDLRRDGFTRLLFELVMRYRRPEADGPRVTNYLAWPVHLSMSVDDLSKLAAEIEEFAGLALMARDGSRISLEKRKTIPSRDPSDDEWAVGLTSMRRVVLAETDARIVMGGQVAGYKGEMPGIAEEVLLSFKSGRPTFLIGGFGGCTRDIAETIGLIAPWAGSRPEWPGRPRFKSYTPDHLRNGLSLDENQLLAHTPHIRQTVTLVMRGLHRLRQDTNHG